MLLNVDLDRFSDDGLTFDDGKGAHMISSLDKTDCIANPDNCDKNGFSVGAKLRLPISVTSATVPKYILDSGGHARNTRGVSLFVDNGNLVAEVETSERRWKVIESFFFFHRAKPLTNDLP
mgnify:CR=1 FL=1